MSGKLSQYLDFCDSHKDFIKTLGKYEILTEILLKCLAFQDFKDKLYSKTLFFCFKGTHTVYVTISFYIVNEKPMIPRTD